MARGIALSVDLRKRVIDLHQKGISYKKISEKLSVPKSTIQSLVAHFTKTGTLAAIPNPGKSSLTTPAENRFLNKIVRKNRRSTVASIKEKWESAIGKTMSNETCRKKIHSLGINSYKVRKI